MESAQKFVVKFFKRKTEDRGIPFDELIKRVEEREAAIRKERADRAVECGEKAGMNKLQLASLRAAIEG